MTADTGLDQQPAARRKWRLQNPPAALGPARRFGCARPLRPDTAAAATVPGGYGAGFGLPVYPPAQVDATGQREKQAFLAQPGDTTGASDDLQATLRDPSSPYLVMAGTAIPAVMVGGINSDMPGMVIGQVAENVYDTATGHYLLIPQGARLIGQYDNRVSMGQTRVGVIWNRIIYPDAESIDLGSMEGADQGGYAGFHDQVNTHFWSKIGNALLISIAGAGVQLSQPQAVNGQNYNSQQIAAASLGQQFGELGQEYARAGLSIPNTLEIRPGYRFVVMVNKDMHLRPYIDHRRGHVAVTTPCRYGARWCGNSRTLVRNGCGSTTVHASMIDGPSSGSWWSRFTQGSASTLCSSVAGWLVWFLGSAGEASAHCRQLVECSGLIAASRR